MTTENNRGFRRCVLQRMEKVTLEAGWLLLAHNLLKRAAIDQNTEQHSSNTTRSAALLTFMLLN